MALAVVVRLIYVALTRNHQLVGDSLEYDAEARFISDGKWFWTMLPYGVPHAGAWKAPIYPAWAGIWYSILGAGADTLRAVQAFIGLIDVALAFLLARRLFGYRAGVAAAFVVAVYPLAWQYEVLLLSESLATPLTLGILLLFLGREEPPTPRQAVLVGAAIGVALLLRPTSFFLFAPLVAAYWIAAGAKRGLALSALAAVVAVLVVVPWSVRNHHVLHGWVPISIQDAAAYGTFNDVSANDKTYPYAWRPSPNVPAVNAIVHAKPPLSDVEFRRRLSKVARDYVKDHPSAVPKAFFWNGLSRLWDIRHPGRALDEVPFEGRSRAISKIGLVMYYVLLPLALFGLWRARRRLELLIPVIALVAAASVVFTVDSGTRYRAPLEPLIVVLAMGAVFGAQRLTTTTWRASSGPQ
jgi:4-amino-4-deoxy-L-arabinose transferase-like glycosyltransferase